MMKGRLQMSKLADLPWRRRWKSVWCTRSTIRTPVGSEITYETSFSNEVVAKAINQLLLVEMVGKANSKELTGHCCAISALCEKLLEKENEKAKKAP